MNRRLVVAALVVSLVAFPSFAVRRRAVQHPGVPNVPHAVADAYSVARGQTLTVSAANGVLANDSGPAGKTLTAIVATNPAHGTLTLSADGSFVYVNDASSAAQDLFTYTATDGTSVSAPATVTISITTNPPVAAADSFNATQGQPLTVPAPGVLANDVANGGSISSYGASTGTEQTTPGVNTATAQHGTINLLSSGGFVYNGPANFTGSDGFKYVLTNDGGSSTASVTINVSATAPVASNDSYSTPHATALTVAPPGVLANDTPNGAAIVSYGAATGLEQSSVGSATATSQGGTIVLAANGGLVFTPSSSFSGSDTFKYLLRNAAGSSTATVTITVQAQAGADFSVTSPGFFFSFSGVSGQNPQLTLTRGRTYTFQVNTSSIHPFEITGAPAGSVTNNSISSGLVTFKVPTTATNYGYICPIHGFGGTIVTVP